MDCPGLVNGRLGVRASRSRKKTRGSDISSSHFPDREVLQFSSPCSLSRNRVNSGNNTNTNTNTTITNFIYTNKTAPTSAINSIDLGQWHHRVSASNAVWIFLAAPPTRHSQDPRRIPCSKVSIPTQDVDSGTAKLASLEPCRLGRCDVVSLLRLDTFGRRMPSYPDFTVLCTFSTTYEGKMNAEPSFLGPRISWKTLNMAFFSPQMGLDCPSHLSAFYPSQRPILGLCHIRPRIRRQPASLLTYLQVFLAPSL